MKQAVFQFRQWGGKRKGAGRKPAGERARDKHQKREILKRRFPVHVTVRMRDEVWRLRSGRCFRALRACFAGSSARPDFKTIHYSIQGNHIHFIIEAEDERALTSGMRSLNARIANALNAVMKRKGRVLADRYHARILKTPTETAKTLRYVLRNYEHHLRRVLPAHWRDPFATANAPFAAPNTWLLAMATKASAMGSRVWGRSEF